MTNPQLISRKQKVILGLKPHVAKLRERSCCRMLQEGAGQKVGLRGQMLPAMSRPLVGRSSSNVHGWVALMAAWLGVRVPRLMVRSLGSRV